MATLDELKTRLRNKIGDTDEVEPNISDTELGIILEDAASEYSRVKNYIKFDESNFFDSSQNVYSTPTDCYKVKKVILKDNNYPLNFIDNVDQIILTDPIEYISLAVSTDVLKITYSRYFQPSEILKKELDLYLLYAEALCYKLMASKTAELIKFSTGEKSIDESSLSEKYNELYECTVKIFRSRVIKAYGRRADYIKSNLDPILPYPPEGEVP